MLSLYEILKASKTGIAPDMWTALAGKNWGGADSGHEVKELTDIPPLSIQSNGTMLLDYLISGNMEQTGTPTPTTPIQPQETGERTGNLFDGNYSNIKVDTPTYRSIYVGDGTFTLSTTTAQYGDSANVFFLAGNVRSGASTRNNGIWNGNPRTVTAVDGYVTIAYRYYMGDEESDPRSNDVMLNTGSTPLPYEPYGYKIPISSANTTTPVYLGEVQTTRKIKKLVLDGTENWRYSTSSQAHWIENVPNDYDNTLFSKITTTCTHYRCIHNSLGFREMVNGDLRLYAKETSPIAHELYIKDETYTTATDFKSYLAAQYAAGTPVTVWYVLTEPEIAVVNEPLRKIGDYADTLSMEQAGVQIPTNKGNTVINVEATLKPSEMYIKYQG